MIELITGLAKLLAAGGNLVVALSIVIFAGLISVIFWLLKDRKRLISALSSRDKRTINFIEKFERSQIVVSQALLGVEKVLIELKVRIKSLK